MPDVTGGHNESAERAMHQVPKSQLNSGQQAEPPSLESLPAELRLHILSDMSDFKSLRSLIQASPVYFAQYLIARKALLSRCLEADLGREVLIDAIAAYHSRSSKFDIKVGLKTVTGFLDDYGCWRYTCNPIAMLESMSLNDIRWITREHMLTVQPLAALLSGWALTNLKSSLSYSKPEETSEEGHAPASSACPDGVSRNERKRILRALYRFQIFCDLFADNLNQAFQGDRIVRVFFCRFDSWEVEEINCVYEWIKQRYVQVVAEVRWDLHPCHPKYRNGSNFAYQPDGPLSLPLDGEQYFHATVSRGRLRFALRLVETTDHGRLLELVLKYFTQGMITLSDFFQDCMQRSLHLYIRSLASGDPFDKDLAERRREPMPFAGDEDTSVPLTHAVTADGALNEAESSDQGTAKLVTTCGPPLAWVLMWDGKYCNLYGDYVPGKFRQWGYVLWDERRWNAIHGARQLLLKTWKSSSEYGMAKKDFAWLGDLP